MKNKRVWLTLHIVIFVAIILAMILPVVIVSLPTHADTEIFFSSTSDGYNFQEYIVSGTTWNTIRDAATNGEMDSSSTTIQVGTQYVDFPGSDPGYGIWRGYLFFDTSAIPNDATISSATLKLYGESKGDNDYSFNMFITEGMPTYPHNPLLATDYDRTNYEIDYLGWTYSSIWTITGYNNLVLSSNGLAVINKTGDTKFCLRGGFDLGGDTPLSINPNEYFVFYSTNREGTNYDPKLEVTYTVPVTQVTVITQDADTISETGARLRGQVTEDGNSPCTVWFKYGLADTCELTTPGKEGYWEGSEFADFVVGLQRGQLYYYQAFTSNGYTTGNGTIKTFLTFPAEPSGFTATAGDTEIDLEWTTGDGSQKTMIRYLTTGSYPQSPTDGTQAYFDTESSYTHTGLDNDTTYTYSTWSYATEGGLDEYSISYETAFATPRLDSAPTIETYDASDVSQSIAILHGYLSSLGGYDWTEVSFQWYEDGGTWTDHETNPEYKGAPTLFEAEISALDADTLFYFRAKAVNGHGIAYGVSKSFTTGKVSAPTMLTLPATAKTKTTAIIHGKVSAWGGDYVTAWFEYGKSIPYEHTSSTASGLVTDSPLQLSLGDLDIDTTYHYRIVGSNNYEGVLRTGYGDDETFTTLAPTLPIVSTQTALVGASSATLNGFLVNDGGADCEVRFHWYAESETMWLHESGWQPGKRNNDPFSYYVADLTLGETYYYQAQARNNGNIANGNTQSFTVEFGAPANFIATAISSYAIELTWIPRSEQTYIVVKPTGYSANRTDGALIYFGSSNVYVQMELSPGETYYYRAWSWTSSEGFLEDYSDAIATTLALGPGEQDPPIIIIPPDKPSRWDASPDPSALNGTILYGPINNVADAIGIPQGTFWLLLAVLISVVAGLGVYMLAHSAVIATITMGLTLLGGWWLFIVPLWMIAVMGTMSTGVIYLERRL